MRRVRVLHRFIDDTVQKLQSTRSARSLMA
jgi:hypothetical protein